MNIEKLIAESGELCRRMQSLLGTKRMLVTIIKRDNPRVGYGYTENPRIRRILEAAKRRHNRRLVDWALEIETR